MKDVFLAISVVLLFNGAISAQETATTEAQPDYPRVLVQTNAGDFTLELFAGRSPLTVKNFLAYVDDGFYSGTIFHRVVPGFVAQAGGYDTDYKLKPTRTKVANESGNGLSNRRAYIAMARTSDPHSADSQFYVNLADNTALDPRPTRWGYTVFGRVVDGMTVIDDIGYRATGAGPVPQLTRDVPAEQIVITGMTRIASSEVAAPAAPALQPVE